jgi:hypothetical protein
MKRRTSPTITSVLVRARMCYGPVDSCDTLLGALSFQGVTDAPATGSVRFSENHRRSMIHPFAPFLPSPGQPSPSTRISGIIPTIHAIADRNRAYLPAPAGQDVPNPYFDLLTLADVARLLHCSKAHISKAVSGRVPGCPAIPAVSLGRRKLIRLASLRQWIEDNERFASGATIPSSPERDAGERA